MNIAEVWQTWYDVLTHPGEEIFESERSKPSATLVTAVIWVVIAAAISAILGYLRTRLLLGTTDYDLLLRQMDLPPEMLERMSALLNSGIVGGATFAGIIITPIMFLIGAGILHLVASLLGGEGSYGTYTYLLSAFWAPITVIGAVIAFVPLVGGCFQAILSIYGIVLAYFATMANYRLTSGRALVVILTPIILLLVVGGCFLISAVGLILSTLNG